MPASMHCRTPQQALAALLARYTPQRLLLVGASQLPALEAFKAAHPDCHIEHADAGPLSTELAAQRFDLALFVDCLEHLPKRTALELLAGIRNLNARRLAVLAYLQANTLPAQQARLDLPAISAWSRESSWLGLTVESAEVIPGQPEHARVTFTARDRKSTRLNSSH